MTFDAATLAYVEDALSDSFNFHRNLDDFLKRSGLNKLDLESARKKTEHRSADIGRYTKAPKRFVVQAVLDILQERGESGDRVLAAIITGLTQMPTPDATDGARYAIDQLRTKIRTDQELRAQRQKEKEDEAREAAQEIHRKQERERATRTAARDAFRDRFLGLMAEANSQSRGYLLENLLNEIFDFEGLEARGSFRVLGEQIDGSFVWRDRTVLVEAKWTVSPVAGQEFGAFDYKIKGKTADTRGLFVSINGYSPEAIRGMNGKGELRFVCIDGAHLMRALTTDDGLRPILERVWRHADETGEAYLPAARM